MKSMISNLITALVMFAVAAMPFRLAAQAGNPVEEKPLHPETAELRVDVSPAVNLPDNVRKVLQQRMRFGPMRSH